MTNLQKLRNRPNFFIIGAAKAGTTRLHYLLGQHPEIFTSRDKEPQMFDRETPRPGVTENYIELFEDVGDAKAIGESSVIYSRCKHRPGTARRIHEFNPDARIIYMVRHPLRRLESGWAQQREAHAATPRNFGQTLREDHLGILDASLYWRQLSEYRQYFPDEQILLIFFEEFIRDEAATLRRCFEFLQVAPAVTVDCSTRERQNSFAEKREPRPILDFLRGLFVFRVLCAPFPKRLKNRVRARFMQPIHSKPRWDDETYRFVTDYLREDNQQLLAHAGKPADFWDLELKPEQKIETPLS